MVAVTTAPRSSPLQVAAAGKAHPPVPKKCVVTGGGGFVGRRLVEMLVERGAERVVSFDIAPAPADAWQHPAIEYVKGDLRDLDACVAVCTGADCVWHNGAAVGPYHPKPLYEEVNYRGTLNIIEACKRGGCNKIVMSSSPSTRFDGSDVDGLTEDQMPPLPQQSYLAEYARTKAMGEMALTAANNDDEGFFTVAVAPHQVYGPRDNLFLPNLLETAGTGKLRVFGAGKNRICFSHVDNYAHGLIIAERALVKGGSACGKFYIVTDGATHTHVEGYGLFWEELDKAVIGVFGAGKSLRAKFHLPKGLMFFLAYVCVAIGFVFRVTLKLNPFAVRMLTMHRWFDISAAEADLGYQPIIGFKEGWEETIQWFRTEWLPTFDKDAGGYAGKIAKQTRRAINIQAGTSDDGTLLEGKAAQSRVNPSKKVA